MKPKLIELEQLFNNVSAYTRTRGKPVHVSRVNPTPSTERPEPSTSFHHRSKEGLLVLKKDNNYANLLYILNSFLL